MKKNLFKKMLLISTCLTIGALNVKAAELPTGFTITANADEAGTKTDAELVMTLNKPTGRPDGAKYYTIFVNSQTNTLDTTSYLSNGCVDSTKISEGLGGLNQDTTDGIDITYDWYIASGYEYAYIVEEYMNDQNQCVVNVNSTPIQVSRPDLPAANKMYTIYAIEGYNKLSVFPNYPIQKTTSAESPMLGTHKLVTKIGVVSDAALVSKVVNGTSGAYNELLAYARSNEGTNFNISIVADANNDNMTVDFSSMNLSNGSYYYIYTTVDSSETGYRELTGINLVLADADMLVTDLTTTREATGTTGTTSTKETVKNPKTGVLPLSILVIIVLASLGVGIYTVRKQKQQQV